MKRYIIAAIAVLMILSGCEYHPYYDGQILRVYQANYGLIETDGAHLNVPLFDKDAYTLEIYGGKGKNHKVTISDPELLSYTYKNASIESFMGDGVEPAQLTLQPKQLGNTSIDILDEDTGESINIYLHIVKVYNMLEIHDSRNSLSIGTVVAFEYPSSSEDIKICSRNRENGEFEYLLDAKCRFHDCDTTVMMELVYPSDESGQPAINGTEVTKRYLVQYEEGYVSGEAYYTLRTMNLDYMTVQTRAARDYYIEENYNVGFRFIDITDDENQDPESPDAKIFFARSAKLAPLAE